MIIIIAHFQKRRDDEIERYSTAFKCWEPFNESSQCFETLQHLDIRIWAIHGLQMWYDYEMIDFYNGMEQFFWFFLWDSLIKSWGWGAMDFAKESHRFRIC